MKKIKMRIDKDGNTHIDVEGAQGVECKELTDKLLKALGKTISTKEKPEYDIVLDKLEQKVH